MCVAPEFGYETVMTGTLIVNNQFIGKIENFDYYRLQVLNKKHFIFHGKPHYFYELQTIKKKVQAKIDEEIKFKIFDSGYNV